MGRGWIRRSFAINGKGPYLPAIPSSAVSASIQSKVPAGRFGNPSEIAHAIVFLASDESAFTVGSELLIDGGMGTL